jgi:hypothetical protein
MNVEQTLKSELTVVAAAVTAPPPPPVDALVRTAERSRTRTSARRLAATGLVAAAVVGAIVIGNQIGRPTTAPPTPSGTPTSLPTGGAPQVPYILGETLYVDGKAQPGAWIGVRTAGGNTLALRSGDSPGSTATTAVLFRSGAQLETLSSAQEAMLSPLGSKLAWIETSARDAHLVVRDLRDDRELGRLPLDLDAVTGDSEATVHLTAVDDDGTVHWGGVLVDRAWKPGAAPVDVARPAATPRLKGFPRVALGVELSGDATWGAWLTDHAGRSEPRSGIFDGVTLQRPDEPASRFTLALPEGTDVRGLSWESTTDLLLTVFDDQQGTSEHLVRCSASDRTCEVARTP